MTEDTTTSREARSDWPLFKQHWLHAVIEPGETPVHGLHTDPGFELRDEARDLQRRHGAAARVAQYFEVHLAHG